VAATGESTPESENQMNETRRATTIEFINGIVVAFDIVSAGIHYEVRPRLDAYPHSMKVDHVPREEEIAEYFMGDPSFRRAAGIE
jgi:hypothetical protein